jgi:hypothetical protein
MNVEIPKGWRQIPEGETIRPGDKYVVSDSIIQTSYSFVNESIGNRYVSHGGKFIVVRPAYLPVQITAVSPHKP